LLKTSPKGEGICEEISGEEISGTGPERVDTEQELKLDRRAAILGAGCVALAAILPGSAQAAGWARGRVRPAVATLPRQSPIDLRENEITFARRLPRIRFAYPRKVDVSLVNTGSPDKEKTVRADVAAGAAHITISGVRWDLQQFHWHTPSEHELDGEKTPLEMHFVHSRVPDGAFLVLAVFMQRGKRNRALEPMFRDLPEEENETRDVSGVRLPALLPDERESFRYTGSLTTPPFTEPVDFVVFADPTSVSRRQIGAFQELFPNGNNREVQPLNGREVLSDAEDVFEGEEDD
jgi:carbonic anhydrase